MNEEWKVEVLCLMCGRLMGVADIPHEHAQVPLVWHRARCAVCGGPPMRGEALVEKQIDKLKVEDFSGLKGRPPTWLVKLRQEQAEALA